MQNNLKLTINLIDQLFVIPLSNENSQKTISSGSSNCDKTSNNAPQSSYDEGQCISNQSQHVPESCFSQEQETIPNCSVNSRRSPESSDTPVTSPITNSSILSSSSQMEDIFVPSSPPQASSSPISFRNELSNQNFKSQKRSNIHCEKSEIVKEAIIKDSGADDYVALRSPKSSNITGSVTIRALNEANKSEMENESMNLESNASRSNSKDKHYISDDKSCDFGASSRNSGESRDKQSDSEKKQRQCKKGDTPTEVFKVAALYVT